MSRLSVKNKTYYRYTCFRGDNSFDLVSQSLANGGSNSTMADLVILPHKTYFWRDVVKLFDVRINAKLKADMKIKWRMHAAAFKLRDLSFDSYQVGL